MIYDIAGLRVKINNKYNYTNKMCEEYLSADQEGGFDIEATVTEEDIKAEKALTPDFSDGYIENICLYRSICNQMPLFNRFIMHCSIVEYKGEAYVFLGKSGAGKSTHSKLWLEYEKDAEILNGDKPIIFYDGKNFIAYGTPWNGKEGYGYKGQAVIKALCFIEQSKTNSIVRLSGEELSGRLLRQMLHLYDAVAELQTLSMADALIKTVPAYLLYCDISKEAFLTSFNAMTGGMK